MFEVYRPSEDTWLLEDALNPIGVRLGKVAEVGCGSGYITAALLSKADEVVSTDVSFEAVLAAKRNVVSQLDRLHLINADVLSCIRSGVGFDLIVSNPPYLPEEGLSDKTIEGGSTGNEIAERILEEGARLRSDVLLVVSSLSGSEGLERKAISMGLKPEEVISKRFFFEELKVVKFSYERSHLTRSGSPSSAKPL